jgi:tRNA-specific adenosine deaminase 1
MANDPDAIASTVIQNFDRLPPKRKPVVRDNGAHEWVPLSGVVAESRFGIISLVLLAPQQHCRPLD